MQLASLLLQIALFLGLIACFIELWQERRRELHFNRRHDHLLVRLDAVDEDLQLIANGLIDLTTIVRTRLPAPTLQDAQMQSKPPTTGPSGHSFHGHPTVHHDR